MEIMEMRTAEVQWRGQWLHGDESWWTLQVDSYSNNWVSQTDDCCLTELRNAFQVWTELDPFKLLLDTETHGLDRSLYGSLKRRHFDPWSPPTYAPLRKEQTSNIYCGILIYSLFVSLFPADPILSGVGLHCNSILFFPLGTQLLRCHYGSTADSFRAMAQMSKWSQSWAKRVTVPCGVTAFCYRYFFNENWFLKSLVVLLWPP